MRQRLTSASRTVVLAAFAALFAVVAGACSSGAEATPSSTSVESSAAQRDAAAAQPTTPSTVPAVDETGAPNYANRANWLCAPDLLDDPCHGDLDATLVAADGSTKVEPFVDSADPPVDCFYVYPTISTDPTPNADLVPGDLERDVVVQQAARFRSSCRVFAPNYRQVTVAGLFSATSKGSWPLAYSDVLAAWQQFIAKEAGRRGFVLIGHSQGSAHLIHLIRDRIDTNAALRRRLVGAVILGGTVNVPQGGTVGGTFEHVPVCSGHTTPGCVLTFSTFNEDEPPNGVAIFGRTDNSQPAACTNPAGLDDGSHPLSSYFVAATAASPTPVSTPFVHYDGLLTGRCVSADDVTYLSARVSTDRADRRPHDLGGRLGPGWGMHLLDANVAMGNLVTVVAEQVHAYLSGH